MSAECSIHATDLRYAEEDWQAPSLCADCEIVLLRKVLAASRELVKALLETNDSFGECMELMDMLEELDDSPYA